jgi:3-oxoacyl-[acyl-carrier protein] reductase
MNKIALVLAASEGIGFSIAIKLLEIGNKVCIVSRSQGKLNSAINDIVSFNSDYKENIISYAIDISSENSMLKIKDFIQAKWGRSPDILINNNGGPKEGSLLSLNEEEWLDGFNSYAMPVISAIKVFSLDMIKNNWGKIITIGSIAAKEPIPNLDISNFVRSGLLGLHKSISKELAKDNINVHMVLPASILTSRSKSIIQNRAEVMNISFDESMQISNSRIPKGHLGDPSDVGNLVAFLCSDQANFLTGTSINVDGGVTKSI